jgi:hypothetical protein
MVSLAQSTLAKELNLEQSDFKTAKMFTDSAAVTHIYFYRVISGITVANRNALNKFLFHATTNVYLISAGH